MEAVYRAWNTNFFGTRHRRCEVFDSDVKRKESGEFVGIVPEYSFEKKNVAHEGTEGFKKCSEPLEVAGSAVLLWLPPPVSASKKVKYPQLENNDGVSVSFINVYPSSSNGLKNLLNLDGSREMEQRCLVNLIPDGHTPVLGALPSGSLVTVHDVAVAPDLLASLKSQNEINCFCQSIIKSLHFTPAEQQSFSNGKISFHVVFQVQNEGWYGDIWSKILCNGYSNGALEPKNLKTESLEESVFSEDCLQCINAKDKISDLNVTGIQTYCAAYVSPIVKTLDDLEQEDNSPKSLFYLAGKTLQQEFAGFCIDFKNCSTSDFKPLVKNGNLLLSVGSNLPICLSVEVPANLKLDQEGFLFHWNIDNILYFISKVQSSQKLDSSKGHLKKILDHSVSFDSGIGSDELQCKNWLSFDMLEVEVEDIFQENEVNTNEFLELFGHKLLSNSILLQSDFFDGLNTSLTSAIADQKPICDTNAPVTETKIRKNEVTCSPSFEISQTFDKVHIAVSCSNLHSHSVEIHGESETMIGISFLEVDRAVRQHIYISSVDPCSLNLSTETNRKFGFEDCEKNNIEDKNVLKNIVICPEKVLVSFMKSTPASWDAVWAGAKGRLAKIILSNRALSHLKPVKNAEPLRIEQQPTAKTEPESQFPTNTSQLQNDVDQVTDSISEVNEVSDRFENEESEAPCEEFDQKVVNVNKKKRLGKLIVPVQITSGGGDDEARTSDNEISDNEAVKIPSSPLENKEKCERNENENERDRASVKIKCSESSANRYRRSSECVIDGSVSDARKSFAYRPRSILKRRGRSYSESHVGSLEECLGEELLGKYGSVEKALVVEYGCFEGLREECGWDEDEDDEAFSRSDELESSVGSKKNVRFNDVSQTHLFMSKASILNQIANDDKKAMRLKMKESKKKQRNEKRMAHRSGNLSGSPRKSFDSSYRGNSGYSSQDEGITTEESDGGELVTSSSGETTDNTTEDETDNEKPNSERPIMEPSVLIPSKKNQKVTGRKRGRKCNKKRVELTNSMIFQLDMEA